MDARLQRRVQRYGWDKAANDYERFWAAQLAPAQRQLLDMAAVQPGDRVLDIACGTGLVTFPAAEAAGSQGHVVATDISERMVEAIAAEAARRNVTSIEARRMEAESLDFPDASFDVVLCALGLMYVPDVPLALKETLRVLKPGGRAVAAVWGARARCGWAEIFPIVERRVASDVCPMFFQLGTGDLMRQSFVDAGFADVRAERLSVTLDYADGDQALGAAFAGGPVALAYSRFDDETRDSAHAEYLESIAGFRDGAGYRVPGEFVVVKGTVPFS